MNIQNPIIANLVLSQYLMVEPNYLNNLLLGMSDRFMVNPPTIILQNGSQDHQWSGELMGRGYFMDSAGVTCETIAEVEEREATADKSIAIVPVQGSLVTRGGRLQADSSVMRGYNNIKNELAIAANSESVGGALMLMESPGGSAMGNDAVSAWIREISMELDFPIWAYGELAASSAYNIGAAANQFYVSRAAMVGSIGVVYTHVSEERSLKEDQKLDVTFVYSGAHKIDGNGAESLPDTVRAELKTRSDHYWDLFTGLVSQNRGITQESVRAMEAKVFNAEDSLSHGLIDGIDTEDGFVQKFFDFIKQRPAGSLAPSDSNSQSIGENTSSQIQNTNYSQTTTSEIKIMDPETPEAKQAEADKVAADQKAVADRAAFKARSKAIMDHPNAAANSDQAWALIDIDSMTVEMAHSMLDKMTPPPVVDPKADAEAKQAKEMEEKFGDVSGLSQQGRSILQNVYALNQGKTGEDPNLIQAEASDFVSGAGAGTEQKTPEQLDDDFISQALADAGPIKGTKEATMSRDGDAA